MIPRQPSAHGPRELPCIRRDDVAGWPAALAAEDPTTAHRPRTIASSASYRHIRGDKKAGLPGHAPFPTLFHPLVTLSNLEAFAEANGLQMIYRKQYESPRYPEMRLRMPAFAALVDAAARVMNFFLPGKTDVRRGDYHVILRKR